MVHIFTPINRTEIVTMNEMFPFIRFAWKTAQIQNEWEKWRNKMARLSYETEYQSVVTGIREANVYHLNSNSYDIQIEKVFLDGLVFLPIQRVKSYEGFAHRHYPTKQLNMNTLIYGVVARDLQTAEQFREAHYGKINHKKIGKMLGYPECCVDFFDKTFTKGILDPVFESALTGEGTAFTNPLLRYAGFKILPFFPCSFDCKEAYNFGEKFFKLMLQMDSEAAKKLKLILEMPCKWSLKNQVVTVEHELFYLIANGYPSQYKEVIYHGKK